MTTNFRRIMSGLVCLLLVAIALRGWMTAKKTPTPASAGVGEGVEVPVASAAGAEATNNHGPVVVRDKGGTVKYQPSTSSAPVAPRNPYIGQ
jgi:hypothetical protein